MHLRSAVGVVVVVACLFHRDAAGWVCWRCRRGFDTVYACGVYVSSCSRLYTVVAPRGGGIMSSHPPAGRKPHTPPSPTLNASAANTLHRTLPPSLSPLPVPSSTVVVGRPRTSLSVVVHTLAPPPAAHLGKLAGNTYYCTDAIWRGR